MDFGYAIIDGVTVASDRAVEAGAAPLAGLRDTVWGQTVSYMPEDVGNPNPIGIASPIGA